MARNHYTKVIRKEEQVRLERQESELLFIAQRLRQQQPGAGLELLFDACKVRRSRRLELKRRHKPARPNTNGGSQ